ncbi:MAG: lipopolysaccharide transport system ATP-binding protein [Bacteriovoracaceae bacterium]|jgi:lipopolysaccharide transport system ATP-binding protein
MDVIIFKNVCKYYPKYHEVTGGIKNFLFNLPTAVKNLKHVRFEALNDITFTIKKGEAVGFIGRNGAGKSTTLGLIAGVLEPTSGELEIKERISPLLELGGGFHHELTGRENIRLNGVLLGLTLKEVMSKMDQIIEFSELGEFIDQPVRAYSSGMKARLGFSVIAHLDPKILLIDEVLGVGDAKFREKCKDKIMEFKKEGVTIALVSHSVNDVIELCDRAIWIEDRKVKSIGNSYDVCKEYSEFMGVKFEYERPESTIENP